MSGFWFFMAVVVILAMLGNGCARWFLGTLAALLAILVLLTVLHQSGIT